MRNLVVSSLLFLLSLSLAPVPVPAQQPEVTFRSSANLVLVDVVAMRGKTGVPDSSLNRDDFRIFDNGQPVPIKTFDSGAQSRPLALWFVVQCRMEDYADKDGSGLFRGRVALLKPALNKLNEHDTVAVAHWCDNGDSKIDLQPTSDISQVAPALEQVLAPTLDADDHDRTGELALERTLQLVVDGTRPLLPERVPVVIFLYGDHSGMPRSEADHLINGLLETSATAYGLKDRRSPQLGRFESVLWHEQAAVANYIAIQTGGQYFRETAEAYATGLEEILRQLHLRYELGLKPEVLDGKRHKLEVKLARDARNQYKGVRLRYRAAYVANPAGHEIIAARNPATRATPDN